MPDDRRWVETTNQRLERKLPDWFTDRVALTVIIVSMTLLLRW